ncbi:MAG: S8 family serine peptidase [Solirubrobacterales bacterium]|nr:S8 family serine peptidase [Solirubrobacterales bacterium]
MKCHSLIRRCLLALGAAGATLGAGVSVAAAADYVPGEVVVGYRSVPFSGVAANRLGIRSVATSPLPGEQVVKLAPGVSVGAAIRRLRGHSGIAYAAPDYLAHEAGSSSGGRGGLLPTGGWWARQWNFHRAVGVNASEAWANLVADGRPGGRGVVVAILDTGVAYRDWQRFRISPAFVGTRFVAPYDFIAGNRYPLDRLGHGTFIAGTIADATDNGAGLAGLAYGASIMPVRVLDDTGAGDAITIARGIRYAVLHGAQVINLSLEFDMTVTAGDIPDVIAAISFAHRHGVVVVAPAGNDSAPRLAYPARVRGAISVGATTLDRCLADYSNTSPALDLVAPGGGDDADLADRSCDPARNLPDIMQMTFLSPLNPARFGLPAGWYGTSMACPHVAAAAALVIASGVLGPHPSPDQILERLEQTAQPLGGAVPNPDYGYGLLDAGAATARTAASAGPRGAR